MIRRVLPAALLALMLACPALAQFTPPFHQRVPAVTGCTPTLSGTYSTSTDGAYTIATFTGNGTFAPTHACTADTLVVAGGGGGGGGASTSGGRGGGGAGGLNYQTSQSLTVQTYTVTVGSGGSGGGADANGIAGNNSSFGSLVSATGGGYGNGGAGNGGNGGSGGG